MRFLPASVATDLLFTSHAARHDQLSKSAGKSGFKMCRYHGRTAHAGEVLIAKLTGARSRLKAVERSTRRVHRKSGRTHFDRSMGFPDGLRTGKTALLSRDARRPSTILSPPLGFCQHIARGLPRTHSSRARLARARRRSKRTSRTRGSSFRLSSRSSARSFSRSPHQTRLQRGLRRPSRSSRFFSSAVRASERILLIRVTLRPERQAYVRNLR